MKKLENLSKIIDSYTDFFGKLSGLLIVFLIALVSISVVLRYLFSIGFIWLQDLYIWTNAASILFGISYTLKQDGHVRIDLFYRNNSDFYKKIINIFGYIFLSIPLCFLLISKGYEYYYRSYTLLESSKEAGGLPAVYILKFLIFFMAINLIIQIINQIYKIIRE